MLVCLVAGILVSFSLVLCAIKGDAHDPTPDSSVDIRSTGGLIFRIMIISKTVGNRAKIHKPIAMYVSGSQYKSVWDGTLIFLDIT